MITGQKGTRDQCVETTRWTCADALIASTHTSVHGARGPIQGTNAPTSINSPFGTSLNGGQIYNSPMHDNESGFAPRKAPLKNDYVPPTTFEQIPTAPQAKMRAVRAPPHHVEPPAPARGSACTPHSSHPGSAQVALSSSHAGIHNTSFPPGNNKGPTADYDMPNLDLANSPINVTNLAIKLRDYALRQ